MSHADRMTYLTGQYQPRLRRFQPHFTNFSHR
jgi:hypothetical protein